MNAGATDAADDFTLDDIEAAYTRALEAVEAAELSCQELVATDPEVDEPAVTTRSQPIAAPAPEVADATQGGTAAADSEPLIQPRQIVEAALFVGGAPLTSRRLSQLLGDLSDTEHVADLVENLNQQYRDECRPYEISFGEGGYQLTLRPEFEPVRARVYGAGPRDVKLSQDVLEALAFVAYRQPVTREDLEAAGKAQASSLLQQLLRRQLIELHRTDDVVTYTTTARFLQVFGLGSLNDLPLPEDLDFK